MTRDPASAATRAGTVNFSESLHRLSEAVRNDPLPLNTMLHKNAPRYRAVLETGLELLDRPGMRILDYGCGHPFMLALFGEAGHDVTGFEPYADESHDRVAALLRTPPIRRSLPEDDQYDLVLMVDVIEHLAILRPTMTDVVRRIRPGGRLLISTPNGVRFDQWLAYVRRTRAHPVLIDDFLRTDNDWLHHQREFTMRELERTVQFYGLDVERSRTVDTTAEWDVMAAHRRARGDATGTAPREPLRHRIKRGFQRALPESWQNNLILVARRPETSGAFRSPA